MLRIETLNVRIVLFFSLLPNKSTLNSRLRMINLVNDESIQFFTRKISNVFTGAEYNFISSKLTSPPCEIHPLKKISTFAFVHALFSLL